MEFIRTFIDGAEKHDVRIHIHEGNPYFCATDVGKLLDMKDIRHVIQDYKPSFKAAFITDTPKGKHELIFLSESGLYKFLMRSNKPKAEPFQEWVTDVIKSIAKSGKYELDLKAAELRAREQAIEEEKTQIETKRAAIEEEEKQIETRREAVEAVEAALREEGARRMHELKMETHNQLINLYRMADTPLVYIGEIQKLGDRTLIKIGSTTNLRQRLDGLLRTYGTFRYTHVFPCVQNTAFEKHLHKHPDIRRLAYTEPVHDGSTSVETYMVYPEDLNHILAIIKKNISRFKDAATAQHEIELQRKVAETERYKAEFANNVIKTAAMLLQTTENKAEAVVTAITTTMETAIQDATNQTLQSQKNRARGFKIQKYTEDGKILLQTYPGAIEALRGISKEVRASRPGLMNAIEKRIVYCGHRWATLERELPDTTVQDIGETDTTAETVRHGYIAALDIKKERIVKVFVDQNDAAAFFDLKNQTAISRALCKGSTSRGHYFVFYADLNQELKDEYLSREALPPLTARTCGRPVEKLHPVTREVVKHYASISDLVKDMPLNKPSLKDAIAHGTNYKGFLWRYADTDAHVARPPPRQTRQLKMVAMLNQARTEIIKVFKKQGDAAKYLGHSTQSSVSKSIRQGTVAGGHIFMNYDDVSDELKEVFLTTNDLPGENTENDSSSNEE